MRTSQIAVAWLAHLLGHAVASPTNPKYGSRLPLTKGTWTETVPLLQPWQEGGVAATDDRIYVIGGIVSNYSYTPTTTTEPSRINTTTLVQYFDIAAQTWHDAAPLPISINHGNAASVAGKIYLLGGLSGTNLTEWSAVANSYVYDPTDDSWTEIASMPKGTARGACAVGRRGSEVYLAGGMTTLVLGEGGLQASVATVTSYNTRTDTWTTNYAPLPAPRDHVAGAVIGKTFYVTGGRDQGQRNSRNNTWALNLSKSSRGWVAKADMPTARGGPSSAAIGRYLFTFGGEGNPSDTVNRMFDNVEVFDSVRDEWYELGSMSIPRHGTGAVAIGGTLYVPGGGVRYGAGPTVAMSLFDPWSSK